MARRLACALSGRGSIGHDWRRACQTGPGASGGCSPLQQNSGGSAGWGNAPSAGGPGSVESIVVSSETDPDATNISLSLEEGYYTVELRPGWSMEKSAPSGTETVEATLLSPSTQWVYVSRQSTSWAEFSFGIGGREIWLNGKLNIAIDVQETPGGSAGYGGFFSVGGAGGFFAGTGGASQ